MRLEHTELDRARQTGSGPKTLLEHPTINLASMSTWARPGSDRTQRFSENLPRTLHSAIATGRAIVSFRTLPGPSLLWSGAELQPSNIVRHPEGESAFQRSVGSACFASVSLPVGEMVSVGQTIAGLDLTPPKDPLILTSSPSAIVKLRRLHAAATDLARLRRERNRWFADSPLEGRVRCELVSDFLESIKKGSF